MHFTKYSMFLLILIAINCSIKSTVSEIFTSTWDMYRLVDSSIELTKKLEKYLKYNDEWDETTERVLKKYHQTNNFAKKDVKKFIGNPINSFLLIKQLTKTFKNLISYVEPSKHFLDYLENLTRKLYLPNLPDYVGIIESILRLQETYNISAKQLFDGKLNPNYPSIKLTALDCFDIGKHAFTTEKLLRAFEWLKVGHRILDQEDSPFIDEISFKHMLLDSAIKAQDFEYSKIVLNELLQIDHKSSITERLSKSLDEAIKNPKKPNIQIKKDNETLIYETLCRGEKLMSPSDEANLNCFYTSGSFNFLIGPLKTELLHLDPPVLLYHDAITDNQAKTLKKIVTAKLEPSFVYDPKTGMKVVSRSRIGKVAWLNDSNHHLLPKLSGIIHDLTKLDMNHSEPWQIANYGIGGFYSLHFDFLFDNHMDHMYREIFGNRIATWMIYLEEPDMGGSTVFTELKISIKPKYRSAVLWYNFKRNGNHDLKTKHAGCPVLYGSKWIANKWISTRGQELTRKCSLNPNE